MTGARSAGTLRIALVTREYPPETDWGGIGSFYASFARALAGAGHEVEVFCQALTAAASDRENGVLVHRLLVRQDLTGPGTPGDTGGNPDLGVFVYSLAARMLEAVQARHAAKPFDVIEGHEHLAVNALINASRPAGVVTVTRYQGAYHTFAKRGAAEWPVSDWVRLLEKQSIHAAGLRIAPSSSIDAAVREDFGAPAADAIIPHFIAPGAGTSRAAAAPRDNVLLYVGRMMLGVKRPDLAVQAFVRVAGEFPSWRLHVVGADHSTTLGMTTWEYCRGLVPDTLREQVRYFGRLAPGEVQEAYRRAKILIMPSAFEPFGMVAIEAMREGCVPVVATGTAPVDIVGDDELVFANGSCEDLVARLRPLMASDALLQRKRQACLGRFEQTFSTSAVLERNERAFRAGSVSHGAPPRRDGWLRQAFGRSLGT